MDKGNKKSSHTLTAVLFVLLATFAGDFAGYRETTTNALRAQTMGATR